MSGTGRPKLSVLLITLNEERLLDRVLRSVEWADEIVIVDSGSTDGTEEIARRYTPNFFVHQYVGEGEQRRRSLEHSSGDWILFVDGDEIVTPELRDSIGRAIQKPGGYAGFKVQLRTRMLGRWFGSRGWRREWKLRLFSRDRGTFSPEPVHAGARVEGRVGRLKGPLLHLPYRDLEHLATKLNRYSSVMAAEAEDFGRSATPISAVGRGVLRFGRDYLLGGDFLYGSAGLVRSVNAGYFTFLKHAKIWERRTIGSDAESDLPPQP